MTTDGISEFKRIERVDLGGAIVSAAPSSGLSLYEWTRLADNDGNSARIAIARDAIAWNEVTCGHGHHGVLVGRQPWNSSSNLARHLGFWGVVSSNEFALKPEDVRSEGIKNVPGGTIYWGYTEFSLSQLDDVLKLRAKYDGVIISTREPFNNDVFAATLAVMRPDCTIFEMLNSAANGYMSRHSASVVIPFATFDDPVVRVYVTTNCNTYQN